MKSYMYILQCADDSYYTGSTKMIDQRIDQHLKGVGANFTIRKRPIRLVYYEEFDRIDEAFQREKQVQKWSRSKKEALIRGDIQALRANAACKNTSHFSHYYSNQNKEESSSDQDSSQ
jgi:putative endonuclease